MTNNQKFMVIPNFDYNKLRDLGYTENLIEGGWVSKDSSTIVIAIRQPYIRQVMQFKANTEDEFKKNIELLKQHGFLELLE